MSLDNAELHEETRVRAVIDSYLVATKARDVATLKSIFDDTANMSGWLGDTLLCGSVQPFYDYLEANEVADDYTTEIMALSVNGKMALVETKEDNLFGMDFTNHFQLIKKEDDSWKITAKLFRHY